MYYTLAYTVKALRAESKTQYESIVFCLTWHFFLNF
jgi:hypothetical protein